MKLFIAIIPLLFASDLLAQTSFDRDLEQLTERRDEDLAAATEPIHRKYRASLETLLQKATRAGEVDAAIRIRDALSNIPASVLLGRKHPETADDLKKFLHETTWNVSNGSPTAKVKYTLTFNKNGTFKVSDGRTGKYQAMGPNTLKLWNYDPATFDEYFTGFRAVGTATVYFGKLKAD